MRFGQEAGFVDGAGRPSSAPCLAGSSKAVAVDAALGLARRLDVLGEAMAISETWADTSASEMAVALPVVDPAALQTSF